MKVGYPILLAIASVSCTCSDKVESKEAPKPPSLFQMHVEPALAEIGENWEPGVKVYRVDNDEAVCYVAVSLSYGTPSMQCKWRGM